MIYRIAPSRYERNISKGEKCPRTLIRASSDSSLRLYGYRFDEVALALRFELSKIEASRKNPRRRASFARLIRKIAAAIHIAPFSPSGWLWVTSAEILAKRMVSSIVSKQ